MDGGWREWYPTAADLPNAQYVPAHGDFGVWGAGSLLGIFSGLLGGMIGDIVGPKRVLVASTPLGGLLIIARGWAGDVVSMTVITILLGAIVPVVLIPTLAAAGAAPRGRAEGYLAAGLRAVRHQQRQPAT